MYEAWNCFEECTVTAAFVCSEEAGVIGLSQKGHSRSTSPVRRFDRIWFDCQPAFEIHTALDFKYPSYSGGKAGYQSLTSRRLVFKMWHMEPQHRWLHASTSFLFHWCNSVMSHARADGLMSAQHETPHNSPVVHLNWTWSARCPSWQQTPSCPISICNT